MNKNFFSSLYKSFIRTNGYAIAVIGTLATLIGLYARIDYKIELAYILPLPFISLILIIALYDNAITHFNNSTKILPKVVLGRKPPPIINNALAILLLDASPLFGFEFLVTVYFVEDNYEMLIGVGYVFNIQEDGRIQVAILKDIQKDAKKWDEITNNNSDFLKKLIVKPGSRNMAQLNEEENDG